MFSSATVATSAIFCCTSRSSGCETWLYRYATAISTGAIASEISASFHEIDEDDDPDADDREDVLEEEDQAVAEEEAHALQVDGRAAHQLAGLVAVVEAEREADELRVDGLPHVELDGERLLAGDQPAAGHHQRARDPERDDERDEPLERCSSSCRIAVTTLRVRRIATSAAACEPIASTIETISDAL